MRNIKFSDVPNVLAALKVLEKHNLYKIEDNYYSISPTLHVRREVVLRDIRNALVKGNIKICDESFTKDGQYRSDWIILDEVALCICALRGGGCGAFLHARCDFDSAREQWGNLKPHVDKRQELIQSAYDKLTPEERIATGLAYKRGIKK